MSWSIWFWNCYILYALSWNLNICHFVLLPYPLMSPLYKFRQGKTAIQYARKNGHSALARRQEVKFCIWCMLVTRAGQYVCMHECYDLGRERLWSYCCFCMQLFHTLRPVSVSSLYAWVWSQLRCVIEFHEHRPCCSLFLVMRSVLARKFVWTSGQSIFVVYLNFTSIDTLSTFFNIIFSSFTLFPDQLYSLTHIMQQRNSRLQAEVNAAATGLEDPNTKNEVSEFKEVIWEWIGYVSWVWHTDVYSCTLNWCAYKQDS